LPFAHLPFAISPSAPPHSVSSSLRLPVSSQPELRSDPLCRPVLDAINAGAPAPIPTGLAADPEPLTDLIAARLHTIPDPTGNRLFLAIYDMIDLDLRMSAKIWDPFKRALEASPFTTCRTTDAWTRTDHPLERQQHTNAATRKYTFTNTHTGETKSCTLTLTPRGPHHPKPTHWWLTHLDTT
jgi:hypothetical protein